MSNTINNVLEAALLTVGVLVFSIFVSAKKISQEILSIIHDTLHRGEFKVGSYFSKEGQSRELFEAALQDIDGENATIHASIGLFWLTGGRCDYRVVQTSEGKPAKAVAFTVFYQWSHNKSRWFIKKIVPKSR